MKIPDKINTRKKLEIFAMQLGLQTLGANVGKLDGSDGPITQRALHTTWNKHTQAGDLPKYAELAYSHLGEKEVPGAKSNPLILKWIKSVFSWGTDDGKIAWCAIFINVMMEQAGITGTGKANARSFLDWGTKVTSPRRGDIVIFSRGDPNGWRGHVAIYWDDANDGSILVLGGNQRDAVSIAKYSTNRLLGYRRATSNGESN